MSTDPNPGILDRHLSVAAAQEAIDCASGVLQELVNWSTHLLIRAANSARGDRDEDVAPLSLFRTSIELLDGIDSLIRACSPTPAIPVVRALFEVRLSLEYILEDSEKFRERSLSWSVFRAHQRLRTHAALDPSTDAGRKFQELQEQDAVARRISLPEPALVLESGRSLRSFLAHEHLTAIEAEYHARRKLRNWFQMFGGPASVRELAIHLKHGAEYEVLYRHWSRVAHGYEDLAFQLDDDGDVAFCRIREHGNLLSVACLSASFMLEVVQDMIAKYRAGEDYRSWYVREIREGYARLCEIRRKRGLDQQQT